MGDTRSSATSANPGSAHVDLSRIPEPMRSVLLKQMEKMPAQSREKLLREGSPLLDRMVAKARERQDVEDAETPVSDASSISPDRIRTVRQSSGSAAPLRVQTVSPGDVANGGTWLFVCAVVLAGAVWVAMHGG